MSRARKQTSSAMPSVALDEAMAEEARAQTHLAACREALEGASVDDAEHLSVAVVRAEAALRVAIRTREACAAVARAAREAELRDELARCLAAASERDLLHESADIARHIHDIEHEAAQRVLALRSDWGAMVAAQNEALARAMTIAEELGEPPPEARPVTMAWAQTSAAIAIEERELSPDAAERLARHYADHVAPWHLVQGSSSWDALPHRGVFAQLAALRDGPSAFHALLRDVREGLARKYADYDREAAEAAEKRRIAEAAAAETAHQRAVWRFESFWGRGI